MTNTKNDLLAALMILDPAMANVMSKFLNSTCVGAGKVGSNGSTDCNETMMSGKPGEHVCFNHFAKPNVSGGLGDIIFKAAADKSNGVPAPKKAKRRKAIWCGVNGKQTGGIV